MKIKKKNIVITVIGLVLLVGMIVLGFSLRTEADVANHNLTKDADYFSCERKITVYNARTDTIILEATGYMSLSNNEMGELIATFKVGENEYKKSYIYLNDNVLYVVEDISGTHTDPYHYEMVFHTQTPVSVEAKP